jgi:hypothetical protein
MNVQSRVNHLEAASVGGRSATTRSIEAAGAIAGLAGGLAMALVGAVIALAVGADIWHTPKAIGSFLFGPAAVATPGFVAGPVLAGSILHVALSALFGAVFALLISRVLRLTTEYGAPVVGGLVFGALIWMIAYFVVAPLFNPLLLEVYAPSFIIQNLVYGTVTGLVYTAVRPEAYTYLLRTIGASPSASAE